MVSRGSGSLAWQFISLGAATAVDQRPNKPKVIHSNLQESHRLTGSNRVSADETLWMNLWKLWIAGHCCHRLDKGVSA